MNILNIIKATFVKLKNKEKLRSAKSAIVDSKDVFEGSNFIGKNAVVKDCQIGFASYVAYESHIEHCQICLLYTSNQWINGGCWSRI